VSLYKVYSGNFDKGQALLSVLVTKKPDFAVFLQLRRRESTAVVARGKLGLQTFLITPIQRVPRYSLLLADLFRHTPLDHGDYSHLSAAQMLMKEVTATVDHSCPSSQYINKLTQIQHRFTGNSQIYSSIVQVNRRFLHEGPVIHRTDKKKKPALLILFNDCIILAHRKLFNGISPKLQLDLQDVTPYDRVPDHLKTMSPALACVFFLRVPGKSYCIVTKKQKEKNDWVEMINRAKVDLLAIRDASSYAKSVRVGTSQRRPSSGRPQPQQTNLPSALSPVPMRKRGTEEKLRREQIGDNTDDLNVNKTIPQEERNGQAHVAK